MGTLRGLLVRIRAVARGQRADRDLDEEIRFHLDMEAAQYERLGLSPDEARRRARVAFGGRLATREAHRDARAPGWLTQLPGDVRHAVRVLRRAPALTVAATLTLALAIGANTAIFSAVDAVILRPLPFARPDRLVALWESNPDRGWVHQANAVANMLDWSEQVPAFEGVAGYGDVDRATLLGHGDPQLLPAARVTGNFFSVLGVRPLLGRGFTAAETWNTGAPVVVLSYRTWRDVFGADSAIVGKTITLAGGPRQVVGVMPRELAFPSEDIGLWVPTAFKPESRAQTFFRRAHWMHAFARVRPGVTLTQADAQLQQVVARLQRQYPETNTHMGAGLTPLHDFLVGDTRLPLVVLLSAVALLLLIACANIGNLLLVHAAGRERETAVRLALGAARGRLVRQALIESLTLASLGGIAGLAVGVAGTRLLERLQPPALLRVSHFPIDPSVVAFVVAIAVGAGLVFGIAPTLWNRRRQPTEVLREGGRGAGTSARSLRWGDRLVVAEVAIALLLTTGAGLLVRSYLAVRAVPPGFDPRGVLTVSVAAGGARYDDDPKIVAFYDRVFAAARALPGVESVAGTILPPLAGTAWTSDLSARGRGSDDFATEIAHGIVTPGYFRTMREPLLRGRDFTPADVGGGERVVIINQALASAYFAGRDPIGQVICFDRIPDSTSKWRTVVGVVGDERQLGLEQPAKMEVYEPFAQDASNELTLMIRASGDPAALTPAIRRIIADADPEVPIVSATTMESRMAQSTARERFIATLFLLFAVVGVTLAVVGVYGVLAQLARRRTREIGIRIALGAATGQVRWMVVRHGLVLVGTGVLLGSAVAVLATREMRALLYGVTALDPATFLTVPIVLALAGVAASWFPARQASRADPVEALRAE